MLELLHEAIAPANLIYTTLLGLALIYALSVFMGILDISAIDFDVDVDMDVDVDADVEVSSGSLFNAVLSFFNLGKIPFMFIYSICSLSMWVIGMLLNHYLGNGEILFTIMTFIPVLFAGLIITKILTQPFIPIFQKMNEGAEATDYLGLKATLILPLSPSKESQAEVIIKGDVHRISVRLEDNDSNKLDKGTEVYIMDWSKDKSHYIVSPNDLF